MVSSGEREMGEVTMQKELSAAQYEVWLNNQKKLALCGNEDAQSRVNTAEILAQAVLRRETVRKRKQAS